MKLTIKAEDILLQREWRDALDHGNEHTTVDTGLVSLTVIGLEPDEAKALEAKLLAGVEL